MLKWILTSVEPSNMAYNKCWASYWKLVILYVRLLVASTRSNQITFLITANQS